MPKQVSLIKVKGSIDELSFYNSQDGFMTRKKGRFSIDKFKNDPNYLLTRLNASEFGIGGEAGKTFRDAFVAEMNRASDGRAVSRITQAMISVLQTDTTNDYGMRQVQKGNMTMLEGFDFNIAVPLTATLKADITGSIDRTTGTAEVEIPAFNPLVFLAAPSGVSHFRIFAAAATIDFPNYTSTATRQSTANLPYTADPIPASTLLMQLPAGSTKPIVVVLGVEFMKMVNNKPYPYSKKGSALAVFAVDTV